MQELNNWQNLVFRAGALVFLAGLSMRLFGFDGACWITALGVLLFVCMQMLMRYDGTDFTLQRLRRQQVFSGLAFLVMASLMIMQDNGWGPEWAKGNAWTVCLVVGCVLQVYTAFRIPQELERQKGKGGTPCV